MRKPTDIRTLLRRGERAVCEIRPPLDTGGGYGLSVRADADQGNPGDWLNREDGTLMRFPDPVRARHEAQSLGFPPRWIRVTRPPTDSPPVESGPPHR
mgnify:CR=1 FL=1